MHLICTAHRTTTRKMFHVEHFCIALKRHEITPRPLRLGHEYLATNEPNEQPMARVIAVTNQKGGVGKTTTAINLAASLASLAATTLLVDCDPQSNTSSGLGFLRDPDRPNIYKVLMGELAAEQAAQPTAIEGLTIIPSHKNLLGANIELVTLDHREYRLRHALEPIRPRFDFIVIDCPPALDLLTLNALVAADTVLIPMQAEYFALEGVTELLDTIDRIRLELNLSLAVEGVVLTMFDERTNLAQSVAAELRNCFGQADVAGDRGLAHQVAEEVAQLICN